MLVEYYEFEGIAKIGNCIFDYKLELLTVNMFSFWYHCLLITSHFMSKVSADADARGQNHLVDLSVEQVQTFNVYTILV